MNRSPLLSCTGQHHLDSHHAVELAGHEGAKRPPRHVPLQTHHRVSLRRISPDWSLKAVSARSFSQPLVLGRASRSEWVPFPHSPREPVQTPDLSQRSTQAHQEQRPLPHARRLAQARHHHPRQGRHGVLFPLSMIAQLMRSNSTTSRIATRPTARSFTSTTWPCPSPSGASLDL
jgi:hypothetical protein